MYEAMPSPPALIYEGDDDDSSSLESQQVDPSTLEAREIAQVKFEIYKTMLCEDDLRGYAANMISRWVRGLFARRNIHMYKNSEFNMQHAKDELYRTKLMLRRQMIRHRLYSKGLHMSRPAWKSFMATYIQRGWRQNVKRRRDQKEAINLALAKGLTITWRRTGETRWERIVLNPEERNAQAYNGYILGLPPQSLAFETACAATKISSTWRAYKVRKEVADMRILHGFMRSLFASSVGMQTSLASEASGHLG